MRRIVTVLAVAALVPSGLAYADTAPATTTLISVTTGGTPANSSARPAITPDGRYVAFDSSSPAIVAGDTNRSTDVFVQDRQTGVTTRVSVDSNGAEANKSSWSPSISADGRYVAFESGDDTMVPGDVNHEWDVFLWNRDTATTSLGSVATDGTPGDNASGKPSISADGRHLAFESVAKNFAPGMPEFGYSDNVYARDLVST
jgi:Tol biopolymer transport system component